MFVGTSATRRRLPTPTRKELQRKWRLANPGSGFPDPFFVRGFEHPSGGGFLGKKYDVADWVAPICDSIEHLHSSIEGIPGFGNLVRKHKREEEESREVVFLANVKEVRVKKEPVAETLGCLGCGKARSVDIEIDHREGRYVCVLCGAVGEATGMSETWSEIHNDAEKQVNTARAEVLTRKDKVSASSSKKSVAPAKKKLSVAQELADKSSSIASDALTSEQTRKLASVVQNIQSLCTRVGCSDQRVQREFRTLAGDIFCASVKHRKLCNSKCCSLCVHDRPPNYLARTMIVYVVDKALKTECGIDGVEKESLMMLHSRVHNSQDFTNENSVQTESVLAIVATLDANTDIASKPCVQFVEEEEEEEGSPLSRKQISIRLTKQNSGMEENGKAPFLLQMRNQLTEVAEDQGFDTSLLSKLFLLLHDATLLRKIKRNELVSSETKVSDKKARAFLLMKSFAEEAGRHRGESSSARVSKPRGAKTYGIAEEAIEGLCEQIKQQFPPTLKEIVTVEDKDDLLV